jgi:heme exporter protein B
VFALLTVLLLFFALTDGAPRRSLAGLLWLAILFPSYPTLSRSFAQDVELGTIDVLLGAPIPRTLLFFARVVVNGALVAVTALVAVPAFFLTFGVQLAAPLPLFLATLGLGVVGFAASGTALSALFARARLAEAALPLLVFPLLVPLFLGLVVVTGVEFAGGRYGPWFLLIGVYDLLFLVVPALLFDFVWEVS